MSLDVRKFGGMTVPRKPNPTGHFPAARKPNPPAPFPTREGGDGPDRDARGSSFSPFPLREGGRGVRFSAAFAFVVLLSGCAHSNSAQQSGADDGDARIANKKPGMMTKIMGSKDPVGYGWDGQASSTTLEMKVDSAFTRAMATLKSMGFSIKDEQSGKQGGKVKIQGAKADQTSVSVWLEEPAETPGKTSVRVKVGGLGDRTGSERVLDEMLAPRKKAPPPQSPPPAAKK